MGKGVMLKNISVQTLFGIFNITDPDLIHPNRRFNNRSY